MTKEPIDDKLNSLLDINTDIKKETQVVKLKSLVEDIDFEDEDQFASKVKIVVESHFAKEITNSDEVEQVVEDADQEVEVSSVMEQYLATIRKTTPKR